MTLLLLSVLLPLYLGVLTWLNLSNAFFKLGSIGWWYMASTIVLSKMKPMMSHSNQECVTKRNIWRRYRSQQVAFSSNEGWFILSSTFLLQVLAVANLLPLLVSICWRLRLFKIRSFSVRASIFSKCSRCSVALSTLYDGSFLFSFNSLRSYGKNRKSSLDVTKQMCCEPLPMKRVQFNVYKP